MNCNEFEKIIDRYLDRELTNAEVREVQGHLNICSACREEFGPVIEALTAPWEVEVKISPSLRSRILGNFPVSQKRNFRWVWSAAAAAIILLTVGWLLRPFPGRSQPNLIQPKSIAAATENPPNQPDPWILSGLIQSYAVSGSANPVIFLVQADLMKQWFKETYDSPVWPARIRYTLYIPEPAKPDIEVPILEFTLLSSIQRL